MGHALAMLVSPLVVLFHPLDPVCVRVVEVLETYRFGLPSVVFLVRVREANRHHMISGKQKDLPRSELPPTSSFSPSPDMDFVSEICWCDGQSKD